MSLCTGTVGCGCAIQSSTLLIAGSGSAGNPLTIDLPGSLLARVEFTPTLTGSTTDPALGSTGVARGWYTQVGDAVFYQFFFQFGGTGIAQGSGAYQISYPPSLHAGLGSVGGLDVPRGSCSIQDSSAGQYRRVAVGAGSFIYLLPDLAVNTFGALSALTNSTIGITFAASDSIAGQVTYHIP